MLPQDETRMEEIGWVKNVINGDDEAYNNLVERYHRPVFNLCYRMLGDPGDAEDAAQEAFFRAYKSIRDYDPERKFSTWVLSIASHYCIDQIRKRRYALVSLDDLPYMELPDPQTGPETRAMQSERQQQIQKLLNELAPTDRAAVVMRYWYDFSYEEIASTLELTVSAVKSRLHRARIILAEAWGTKEGAAPSKEKETYGTKTYRTRTEV